MIKENSINFDFLVISNVNYCFGDNPCSLYAQSLKH